MKTSIRWALVALLLASSAAAAEFQECWDLLQAQRNQEAATCLQAVVEEQPDWSWGHVYLGTALQALGKGEAAVAEYRKGMDLMTQEDGGLEPFYNTATILSGKGDNKGALAVLEKGAKYAGPSQQADLHALRGRIRFNLGQHAEAIADLRRSGHDDAATLQAIGLAAYHSGDFALAADALATAAGKDQKDETTARFLALALYRRAEAVAEERARQELFKRAAEALAPLVASGKATVDDRDLLARAQLGAGDLAAAEKALDAVLAADPGNCHASGNLAQIALARRQWDRAIELGTKAAGCLPSEAKRDVLLRVGMALSGKAREVGTAAAEGDITTRQKAIGLYKQAAERFRSSAALGGSAEAGRQAGACDDAVRGLEQNIETIQRNAAALEANTAAEAEAKAEEQRRLELEKARRGD